MLPGGAQGRRALVAVQERGEVRSKIVALIVLLLHLFPQHDSNSVVRLQNGKYAFINY